MRSHQSESSNAQKKIAETEKKIDHANARQAQEFAKTFEEMTRSVMSRATAEIELGVKLTQVGCISFAS